MGHELSIATTFPFVALLLAIAIMPLACGHWWEHNRNKAIVTVLISAPVAVYIGMKDHQLLLHTGVEYVSFIVLLAALFTAAGGIYVTGNLLGTPATNMAFLGIGAILANLVGTTGASMILIRPLIRANSERKHTLHIFVFFIFIVSNCAGLLTPLGDPPLFLGFLRGVPFFWTLRLFGPWLLCLGLIFAVFFVIEQRAYSKETKDSSALDVADYVPTRLCGKINILFLAGILGAVFLPGAIHEVETPQGLEAHFGMPWREIAMLAMLAASLELGPSGPRSSNKFTFGPINEVAILFAGIFAAMIPALEILKARGGELGITQPWQFFWVTGALSSFLDNAPTYLTFATTALGSLGVSDLAALAAHPEHSLFLSAVSAGAVFMGANSYIGNAPNFMVKAVCEESGIRMPSFFGYMLYSCLVLLPIFAVVTLVFFR